MSYLYLQGYLQITGDEYKLNALREYLKGALLNDENIENYIGKIVVTFDDTYGSDSEQEIDEIVHEAIENNCVANGEIIYTDLNGNGQNGVFLVEDNNVRDYDFHTIIHWWCDGRRYLSSKQKEEPGMLLIIREFADLRSDIQSNDEL